MNEQKVKYYELVGTHKEIGKKLAGKIDVSKFNIPAPDFFTDNNLSEALELYLIATIANTPTSAGGS